MSDSEMDNEVSTILSSGTIEQKFKALRRMRDFELPAPLNQVAKLLYNPDEMNRLKVEALKTLYFFDFPSINEVLVDVFNTENDERVRHQMALTMGDLREAKFFDYLLQILCSENEDYNVRYASALSLGKLGDTRAVPDLLRLLNSIDSSVMKSGRNSVIKSGLIMALEKLDVTEAVDQIVAELLAGDEIIRLAAISALAKLGDKTVIPALEIIREQDTTQTWAGNISELAGKAIADIYRKDIL